MGKPIQRYAGVSAVVLFGATALVIGAGCATPYKTKAVPYAPTLAGLEIEKIEVHSPAVVESTSPATVDVKSEGASANKPVLEGTRIAALNAASLGASSGGRSR